MMDCTDRHCRYFLRLLSPNALLYSEMVTTGALIHGERSRFLDHAGDEPVALQLGGSDAQALAQCARWGEDAGYQEINLNCGCPSDRVQVGGIGACLMGEAELVADCFEAMQNQVNIPVTIKSRIGIDDMDSYGFFHNFVQTLFNAGCRVFIVHARAAILSGLSPKENREVPPLKYDYVYRIRNDFPDAVFVLNGGLSNLEETVAERQKVDGVMLGRAVYSAPLLLADLDEQLFNTPPLRLDQFLEAVRSYLFEQTANGVYLKHMARHLLGLFAGWHGARAYRRTLSEGMTNRLATPALFDEALVHVLSNPAERTEARAGARRGTRTGAHS